jgi:hypothetical protein
LYFPNFQVTSYLTNFIPLLENIVVVNHLIISVVTCYTRWQGLLGGNQDDDKSLWKPLMLRTKTDEK